MRRPFRVSLTGYQRVFTNVVVYAEDEKEARELAKGKIAGAVWHRDLPMKDVEVGHVEEEKERN